MSIPVVQLQICFIEKATQACLLKKVNKRKEKNEEKNSFNKSQKENNVFTAGVRKEGFKAIVSASFRTSQSAPGPSTSACRGPAADPWSGSVVLWSGNESGACRKTNSSFTDQ